MMLSPVGWWLMLSGLASLGGWGLSWFGWLTKPGYLGFLAMAAIMLRLSTVRISMGSRASSWRWLRSTRPKHWSLKSLFLVIALLGLLGGLIHAPNNFDGLTYRVPRVLQWLAEGQWHWIHTPIVRMNDRTCGFEWLMTPLILFTGSMRGVFLINYVSFLLMPGLVFSVFRQLGVSSRTSWCWMWILPSGYNFALQASGIGNDTFAVVYALAAVDYALRARRSQAFRDIAFSVLAAALLTGSKPGNLPLLLPWGLGMLPVIRVALRRPLALMSVTMVSAMVSFLPTAALNQKHCGDWTGFVLEPVLAMKNPVVGLAGNAFLLPLGNLVPPVFPWAGWWNESGHQLIPWTIHSVLDANFEPGYLKLGEMPIEEASGVGFGVSLLMLVALVLKLRQGRTCLQTSNWSLDACIAWSGYISLAVFFAKSGMIAIPRLVSAYYPFLVLPLLSGHISGGLARKKWWRCLAGFAMTSTIVILIIQPARPLFPVTWLMDSLPDAIPSKAFVQRARKVYSVYAQRADGLAIIRDSLPLDDDTIGFLGTPDDPDVSLRRPFGTRRVKHVMVGDSGRELRSLGIGMIVVHEHAFAGAKLTYQEWLEQIGGKVAGEFELNLRAGNAPSKWFLVRLTLEATGH